MKATVEEFASAYESASSDPASSVAGLDAKHYSARHCPPHRSGPVRRSEKGSVEARDRRILEFPSSMSPKEVAKALRAEGWYSTKTTVYHIEHRVRRLRKKKAQRKHS